MLPYSIEVLFAIFGQFNRTTWPAPLIFYALALGVIAVLVRSPGSANGGRAIAAVMAVAWAWTGIGFHLIHFAPFNFAAPFYAAAFVAQALLFGWAGAKGRPRYRLRSDACGWGGLVLMAYALVGYPLADWLLGHDWQNLRLFAMAPGPTMLFAMGLLLLAEGRTPYYLLLVPALWGIVAGVVNAWLLGLPQDIVLPVTSLAGTALVVYRKRRA